MGFRSVFFIPTLKKILAGEKDDLRLANVF